jgi:uncharacterized protein (UPF0332 family)
MAYSDDLLEPAVHLTKLDARRPRQANLRRAISTAYYAVFHEVSERAVAAILSRADAAGPIGARARRVIDHRASLRAAKWFAGSPESMLPALHAMRRAAVDASNSVDPVLARACRRFISLQAERHRADYDMSTSFSRADAAHRIADAGAAIQDLRNLPPRGDTLIFLLGCMLGESLIRNA